MTSVAAYGAIQFDHRLKSVSYPTSSTVQVSFENDVTTSGNLLIGTDGGSSPVRRSLLGPLAEPNPLPIYMANFNARYRDPEHAVYIRSNLRHFVDHGVHPKGMFFLMTLQSVPDPARPETWSFQITITWPPELSPNKNDPGPLHTLRDLKEFTKDWASPKKDAIQWLGESDVTITNGFFSRDGRHSATGEVHETDPWQLIIPSDRVSIWIPVPLDNHQGRVTLTGDAEHAMTFHQGQGLNNCIRDAKKLVSRLEKHVKGEMTLTEAVGEYEKEMLDRGSAEVKTSMEQTLKCHNWQTFQHSPVMKIGGSPIRDVENTEWKKILDEQAMQA
jgi:2-polyprenyl-6-methoxyphenol hydroxylase-like FAD-dependent oxidoreductase